MFQFHRLRFLSIVFLLAMVPAAYAAHDDEPLPPDSEPIITRFLLLDHFGEAVTNHDFPGKFLIMYFGYTFCPDVCPSSLLVLTRALELLGEDAKQIQPLFVSVDPQRDTPQVLREYVSYFHPGIIGLTGSQAMIERTASNFRVQFEKVLVPGMPEDEYQMDHSAGLFLISPGGELLIKLLSSMTAEEMAERIRDFL